jgi:hypothetical protein
MDRIRVEFLGAKLKVACDCADLTRIFPHAETRPDQRHWDKYWTQTQFAEPLGLGALPADGNRASNVTKLLSGKRMISRAQLAAIAEYTHLSDFLGGTDETVRSLTDAVSLDEFRRKLEEGNWARSDVASERYANRDVMLSAFREYVLARGGFRVGPDVVATAGPPGRSRGSRFPGPSDDETNLPSFPLQTRMRAALDLDRICALILLEVGPAVDVRGTYEVRCLAPSPLAPAQTISGPTAILPTHPLHGIRAWIAGAPIGRHDWLAILTGEAQRLPWSPRSDAPTLVSPRMLQSLLEQLRKSRQSGDRVEVREYAFRVVSD